MVVRPSMTNSLEMMELIKRQETEMVQTCEEVGYIGQKMMNLELPGRREMFIRIISLNI